jgi:DNA-binding FrmR family transcriptional regulator
MAHTTRTKGKLLARARRIRGQMEAVERALETETECEHVMHLLASARAAMGGLMAEVVEGHLREHLVNAEMYPDALNEDAAEQLLAVIRTYVK